MSIASDAPSIAVDVQPETEVRPAPRPMRRRVMHVVRRGHLYFGLFLFPWALLYGVTAFLFNHPTAFSDQPTTAFDRDVLRGTLAETLPSPTEQAEQVIAKVNERQKPTTAYKLAGEAKLSGREFAFASVKADGFTINVLLDVKNGNGTVRSTPIAEPKVVEKAPFSLGNAKGGTRGGGAPQAKGPRGGGATSPSNSDGIKLDTPLHERFKAAVPAILASTGFPEGEVTITSVPDIAFPVEAEGKTWLATYNSLNGTLTGVPFGSQPPTELSWRRFLTRLHLAHGYPGEQNGRWAWALIVDAMAFTMCFWGLSGLVMWWQIKATRRIGLVILLLSAAAATVLGFAMHTALTS